jgi:hypothetical protein
MSRYRPVVVPLVIVALVWLVADQMLPRGGASSWWFLAAVWVVPYVYAPIIMRPRMSRPIVPPLRLFDPAREVLPFWAHSFLHGTATVLVGESFTVQSALVVGETPTVGGWVALLESPTNGDMALLMLTWTKIALGASTVHLAFRSAFADGTELVTTNHPNPTLADPPRPGRTVLRASDVRDPSVLYRAHRALCTTASASKVPLSCNGDPVAFQRAEALANHEHLVSSGRFIRDEHRGVYRATWPTAIAFAWRNMLPIRPLLRALIRNRTRRLLRELGVAS